MASRRVSRTIMLGSAPDVSGQTTRGIERSNIRLGIVQPGEVIATFNDALGALRSSSSFLYSDANENRYWYDTRPTLRKVMEDRAQQVPKEDAEYELEERLKSFRRCPPFAGLHVCPAKTSDVPDEQILRLVVLPPSEPHRRKKERHIQIKQLWDYLCTYCYLPRLSGYSVLEEAIVEGSGSKEFLGIAAGVGEERYLDPTLGVKEDLHHPERLSGEEIGDGGGA